MLASMGAAGLEPHSVERLVHGTTTITNLLIERTGARVGLITTQGFRDVLEIQLSYRQRSLDISYVKTPPIVPRHLRLEIRGRINAQGQELVPLDTEGVKAAVDELLENGVEAIAVALYNAYVNPAHERLVATVVREVAPGFPLTLSTDVDRHIGEFERTSTAVLNAMSVPHMERYIDDLADKVNAPIRLMHSAGGLMPPAEARERPIQLALSGPAAGVLAAREVARHIGYPNAITMDMGGTSCDVALIWDGQLRFRTEFELDWGVPARVQALDVHTIGAGGGSICARDSGGALVVGPESAGAVPGPVCYGRGGTLPTVTDANLVLGILSPTGLLGGDLPLDLAAARQALGRLGAELDVSAEQVASGIHGIVSANMAQAIREITVRKGLDPRACALIGFGGAAAQHAAAVAAQLEIRSVVLPVHGSILSAVGLLTAPARITSARSVLVPLGEAAMPWLQAVLADLEREAVARLGDTNADLIAEWHLGLRYVGQSHEVPIEFTPEVESLLDRFESAHEVLYGTRLGDPVEIVDCWATVVELAPVPEGIWTPIPSPASSAPSNRRLVLVDSDVRVVSRDAITDPILGPCLVEEPRSVTLVPPGTTARLESGHLVVELG